MHKLGDLQSAAALTDQAVITAISDVIDHENALAAYKYSLLAQFSRRGLNLKLNHSTPAHWLATGSRVPGGNAARQFARAEWLTTRPTVIDALAAGEIHDAHIKDLHDGFSHIVSAHSTLTSEQLAGAVAELLSVARERTAYDVKVRAQELAHEFEEQARLRYEKAQQERARREHERRQEEQRKPTAPEGDTDADADDGTGTGTNTDTDTGIDDDPDILDGPPPQPVSENPALNSLEMYLQANGRTLVRADLDKETAEKLRSAIFSFSRPQPAPDGTRDERTPRRRNADALKDVLDSRAGSPTNDAQTRVNVTVHLRDLMNGVGARTSEDPLDWPFYLTWTGPISHSLARMLSCDADLHPIILDDNGIPMALGSTVRLATSEQRAVVTVRDRCCIKCGKAARYCKVHHIDFWTDGGPTDLDNLTLVCTDCHNDIHNRGWDVAIGDDGHPYVIPPAAIDPERKPLPSYHRRRRPAV